MTLLSTLSNLFCKKRKSSQPSHVSNPAKNNSSTTSKSFNDDYRSASRPSQPDQDGSNDELEESMRTQKILDSEDEDSHSETEHNQRSLHKNGEISAAIASLPKKGHVVQTKKDRNEKVMLFKPKPPTQVSQPGENFMQGAGLQPIVKERRNNQGDQRENSERRSQGRQGPQRRDENQNAGQPNNQRNNTIGTTNDVSLDESDVRSLTELNKISQTKSEKGTEEELREIAKEKALKNLENFYLQGMRVTKSGAWDQRYDEQRIIKFENLCKLADMNPFFYHMTNFKGKIEGAELEERIRVLLKKDRINPGGLTFTSKGLPKIASASKEAKEWLDMYGYPVTQ